MSKNQEKNYEQIKPTFKVCTIDDLSQVTNLCNSIFEENTDPEWAKQVFKQTENDPNNIYINGWVNDEVVSHTKITIISTMYEVMGTYAIINHFCVKNEYRRHHVAKQMMDEIIKICRAKNCKSIKLWSKNFRIAAHSFYKNYGFDILESGFFEKNI